MQDHHTFFCADAVSNHIPDVVSNHIPDAVSSTNIQNKILCRVKNNAHFPHFSFSYISDHYTVFCAHTFSNFVSGKITHNSYLSCEKYLCHLHHFFVVNLKTITPTLAPTLSPTVSPTLSPTITPSVVPTLSPTLSPTLAPTLSPVSQIL